MRNTTCNHKYNYNNYNYLAESVDYFNNYYNTRIIIINFYAFRTGQSSPITINFLCSTCALNRIVKQLLAYTADKLRRSRKDGSRIQ